MTAHPPDVDKDGEDVSEFIEEAVRTLRSDPRVAKVLCCYYRTGRLQVFFAKKHIRGETIRTARTKGYVLDHATTRSGDMPGVDYPSPSRVGYCELIPEENAG